MADDPKVLEAVIRLKGGGASSAQLEEAKRILAAKRAAAQQESALKAGREARPVGRLSDELSRAQAPKSDPNSGGYYHPPLDPGLDPVRKPVLEEAIASHEGGTPAFVDDVLINLATNPNEEAVRNNPSRLSELERLLRIMPGDLSKRAGRPDAWTVDGLRADRPRGYPTPPEPEDTKKRDRMYRAKMFATDRSET